MLSRTIFIGLAALTSMSTVLAQYGVNTIELTTTVTVYTCSPEVASCQERSVAPVATYPASVAPVVSATLTASYVSIPTLSTVIIAPHPTTYQTIATSAVASYPVPGSSEVSSAQSIRSASVAPVGPVPSYSAGGSVPGNNNTTLTAPTLPNDFTSILVATGSPTPPSYSSNTATVTNFVVVKPSATGAGASVSPSASAGAGGKRVANYGAVLGLVALSVCLLG